MKRLLSILFSLLLTAIIIAGYTLWKIDKQGRAWHAAQVSHLTLLSDTPILTDSIIRVSAYYKTNEQRDYVPMIKIIKQSDGTVHGRKAIKFLMQTEWFLTAPSEAGDYILQYEDMEQPFTVYPKDTE